ncbi:hypothetical protein B1C78_11885 [Thioalkalivibrio denitrificans]|uniref:Ribosomal protein L7/L12 C-terminal domain-containing protein n=1 Tax=Thioalkalivibrio denitrificans TaxID=108003 RepID=A0A1V3NE81_9GAMM|nr:hypothetical protein [Thioalkalivibrio denitrificans]OOG23253.1 hypothetical protein B1C78_11885 [Thioalkalivibrio denitrificans]
MPEADYQVMLTGEPAADVPAPQARAALARLFKLSEERVNALIAEAPVVIKRGLDEATARKYQVALQQAGWQAQIGTPDAPAAGGPPTSRSGAADAAVPIQATLAPVGSLMAEPRDVPPLEVDLSGLTLAEPGARIGEPREAASPDVDVSGLTLAPPGARLDDDAQ